MYHSALRSLIERRYFECHGAAPSADYPRYLTMGAPDVPLAAIGMRSAADGPLFLERYLIEPVETVLTRTLGRPVPRCRVVELGDHASARAAATIGLWREAAAALDGQLDVAVAVLTAPLRAMFARLSLPIVTIAPAHAAALGPAAERWGRYYDADPMVCAGEIAACRRVLCGEAGA